MELVEGEGPGRFLGRATAGGVERCASLSRKGVLCSSVFPFPAPHCVYPATSAMLTLIFVWFSVLSHWKDSSNVRKKTLETGHHCSSSSSLPVIHDPPVLLLDPKLYPPQPQFLSPDVLMPSTAGEPYRPPGNTPKLILSAKMWFFFRGKMCTYWESRVSHGGMERIYELLF